MSMSTKTVHTPLTPSTFALMARYNRRMNQQLYDAAARLPETDVFEDRGAFFGSLFGTLNHICVADTIWLHRFSGHQGLEWLKDAMAGFPQPTSLDQRLADSLAGLRVYRDKLDGVITEFADRVTDAQLEGVLHYGNTSGKAQARRLRGLVQHFFNHQTHHRGQATTLLSQAGTEVGVTDLLADLPNEPGQSPESAGSNPGANGISFRMARTKDLPVLVRMLADDPLGSKRETWSDPLPLGYSRAFEEILHDPNNELVVATDGDKLLGMLQITFIPYLTYQGRHRALIEGVRVASDARSRGVGGELIRWAIERARARDCVMVQLTTDRAREDALRFYERLGFVASHHGMKLHLETK